MARRGVIFGALLGVLILAGCGGSSSSSTPAGGHAIQSIFQDDQYLLYAPTPAVSSTLDTLKALGVTTIRATVLWHVSAPQADSPTKPSGFNAADPAAYPPTAFAGDDRLLTLARERGMTVDLNVTAAGPLWAMHQPADEPRYADVYEPSASEFQQFVTALGKRYSGSFSPTATQAAVLKALGVSSSGALPRASYWSIWNEPNQPGWLAPQWRLAGGQKVMLSPVLYRSYVDAAWSALNATGHGAATDTILVGELAPEGGTRTPLEDPIPPLGFLRALYCVDASNRPLSGAAATAVDCPTGGGFATAHPGLFDATGFAHHPYSFFLAPNVGYTSPGTGGFIPLVSLSKLESALDQIFHAYGLSRQFPIYLTEYGYETNPPNPFRGVGLAQQAAYLDQAQYMASQDPRVRSMSQFLLRDALPDPKFPPGTIGYWSTFQTGLELADGTPKPALNAYRLPIWLPTPHTVWGMIRPAAPGSAQRVQIQFRGATGGWQTIATVTAGGPSETFTVQLKPQGAGRLRFEWNGFHSRPVAVG
jgi:hypothetical protein